MNNDGFDLGAQRRPIEKNDIPEIVKIVKKFAFCVSTESEKDFIDDSGLSIVAPKAEIAKNDYVLVCDRYQSVISYDSKYKMFKLGDICDIYNGSTPLKSDKSYWENGTINWFTIEDIREQGRIIKSTRQKVTEKALRETSIKLLPKNSVLLCCTASIGEYALTNIELTTNQQFNGLVVKDEYNNLVNPKYLFYMASQFKQELERLGGQTSFKFVSIKNLKSIQIPLPPIEMQEQIVAELESYQKIIDGAKQVVENYRTTIKVDTKWKVYCLGDICLEIRNGVNVNQIDEKGKYRVTRIQTISDGVVDLTRTKWTNDEPSDSYFMREGDILLSHINSYEHLVKTAIFPKVNEKVVHGINLIRCRMDRKIIDPNYAIIYMKSNDFINNAKKYAQRAVNQASIKVSDLKKLEIPIPSMEEQQLIISKINEERTIVENNKRLIEIFEQKIKDKINEVWGNGAK